MTISTENKNYLDYLKTLPENENDVFEWISKKISILKSCIEVINNHPDELEPSHKEIISTNKIEPAESLKCYIIVEIRNFYHMAYKKFKDSIEYPESGRKDGIVMNFRNNVVCHMNVLTPKEVIKFYEELNDYGFERIYQEWIEFRDKLLDNSL